MSSKRKKYNVFAEKYLFRLVLGGICIGMKGFFFNVAPVLLKTALFTPFSHSPALCSVFEIQWTLSHNSQASGASTTVRSPPSFSPQHPNTMGCCIMQGLSSRGRKEESYMCREAGTKKDGMCLHQAVNSCSATGVELRTGINSYTYFCHLKIPSDWRENSKTP